ncbi:MAG: GNAT family N-acetyltransferase [Rhodothermia bacterium]|nr:GNAT family N-acetyltransferase [Rhodothermia bacterium]
MMSLTYMSCTGREMLSYLDDLARLRITVFREFPYLYDGDLAYEKRYLTTFAEAENAILVLALDGDTIVGASTGIPLAQETDNIRKPFEERDFPVNEVFYFSESVLLQPYRGMGAGLHFMAEREKWAKEVGGFLWLAFCGVVRSGDHPRRPKDYVPLDGFWQKRGFQRAIGMTCVIEWQDVDEDAPSSKNLYFWMKPLL